MPSLTTSPWQATVDRFSAKTVVGSRLRSAEWAQMPVALREQALFSAGVEQVRVVDAMRTQLLNGLQQIRTDGILTNGPRFVADMRDLLGAAPGDSGDLTDLTSVRRLELIWNFQNQSAHAQAAHQADLDPNLLDAFPAYRLVRVESRRVPRHWTTLWGIAGAKVGWVGASRRVLVALKTSPIWTALSRFNRPWPPFDYNSGMGLEDVDRAETEALQLLPAGQDAAARLQQLGDAATQATQDWNAGLAASVRGLSDTARAWLQSAFGNQIKVTSDAAEWTGGAQ